ncbi:MAG TPA: SPOR domain-containing protein [Gammaproteobacteria bacterium]|nr:SPOR domain-containing protein [Gammaproteobacteria bacterium]
MARDYKHATSRKKNKPAATPAWLAFASGLGLGLLITLFVYLHRPAPVATPVAGVPALSRSPAAATQPAPAAAAAKPAPAVKPRFDFYTILPEMEVKVPDWQLGNTDKGNQPTLAPGAYVLQVGSYQRFEEADKAKANLALHGISADIQKVVVNGGDTWFRVRIGPFKDISEVQAMRAKLMDNGQDFMLLRVKDGQT